MLKKALIILTCLFVLSGCSLIADAGTKKELMDQMDTMMNNHDKNMSTQRSMISDFNNASRLGDTIRQSINQGTTLDQSQFSSLNTSLSNVRTKLSEYRQGVDKLLTEVSTVKSKANELKNTETKQRAMKYLDNFEKATESQKAYIDNFQKLADAYTTYFDSLSKGQFLNANEIQEYFTKEGQLVDNFNREINAFNADWKILNEKDFNREVKNNLSF